MEEQKEAQFLTITKPIILNDINILVNNDVCKTEIVKYLNGQLDVRYTVHSSGETIYKGRISEHAKEIWQKAQQQQV
jgi:hypothetical protein